MKKGRVRNGPPLGKVTKKARGAGLSPGGAAGRSGQGGGSRPKTQRVTRGSALQETARRTAARGGAPEAVLATPESPE